MEIQIRSQSVPDMMMKKWKEATPRAAQQQREGWWTCMRFITDTLRVRKLSLNCLFAGGNNNNFDLCRPSGN